MLPPKTVMCPVGEHVELGYLTKGEVCSFVCKECQFIFVWNRQGKLQPPIKLDTRKPDPCDCGACQRRNEEKYFKRPVQLPPPPPYSPYL